MCSSDLYGKITRMSNGNQQGVLNGAPVPRSDTGSNIDRGMTAGKGEKKVLITGGSRGIGAATVMRFVSEGYRTVFFIQRRQGKR